MDHLGGDPFAFHDLDPERQAAIMGALLSGFLPAESTITATTGNPEVDAFLAGL